MNPVALTEMVDRVFADRYRVEELIGVGTVSAVYAAQDLVESRRVAIKVFDETLAADDDFVLQLIEAVEDTTTLRHANIVEILDWGNDGGPYIVMELCEGGSLASLLASGASLTSSQALVVTLECTRALNYAHEQGVIHRNLSPANVLFSADQQVRIADYGLEPVLANAPSTARTPSPESVLYSSPEQARGRSVSEATDLYSLALVINEAVCGRSPQVDATVVGALMQRAEEAAVLDDSLGSLHGPLARCGRVDAEQRPEAEELAIALLATAETMERPAPLPLAGLGPLRAGENLDMLVRGGSEAREVAFMVTGSVADDDLDDLDQDVDVDMPVAPLDRVEPDPADTAPILAVVPDDGIIDEPQPTATGGLDNLEDVAPVFADIPASHEAVLDVPERVVPTRSATPVYEEVLDDADDQLPWWPLAALGVLVAGLVAAFLLLPGLSSRDEQAAVPDLIGVQIEELEELIGDRDWEINVLEDRLDGAAVGSIVEQSPLGGAELDAGEQLTVTVSLGREMVEIPTDLVGLTVEQATSRLVNAGLALGSLPEENNEQLAAGLVIGIDEPTTQKPNGEGVSLRISLGPEERVVPNTIVGLPIGEATTLLVGLRLQPVEEEAYSEDIEVGVVIATIPPRGEILPADSAVVLIVSAGPAPVVMPDIVDLSLEEAIDEIEALGLIWIDTTGTPGENVIGSLPPIGAEAEVGTEVTIILADPPPDE